MNPWTSLHREITGAIRSLRYDLAQRRMHSELGSDTVQLPILSPAARSPWRRKAALLALLALGAVSGYYAVMTGLGTLFATGTPPTGLPRVATSAPVASAAAVPPTPDADTGAAVPGAPVVRPSLPGSPPPAVPQTPSPTGSPPVPTPAPTCACGSPSPTPSSSPTPQPTPSASPTPTSTPTSTTSPEPTFDSGRRSTPSTPFGRA